MFLNIKKAINERESKAMHEKAGQRQPTKETETAIKSSACAASS